MRRVYTHTHVYTHTRVHAKRISMPQTVGQLLVLRRRALENHKLGRSEVTRPARGCTRDGRAARGREGSRGHVSAACRMHLHLKWLRLPNIPLRNHVMRDFYCFLPILSPAASDRRRFDIPSNIPSTPPAIQIYKSPRRFEESSRSSILRIPDNLRGPGNL